ncbi:MAG: LysR substrate-binding domain-containing protein [Serratia liquefaciens]|jgi:DNA-binding transcriptional LysR family regulator
MLSPRHPALQGAPDELFLEDLVNVRQIMVASRDLPIADLRPRVAESYWRTDSLPMALNMVEAGLGWGNFPLSLTAPLLAQGRLIRLKFKNTKNELRLPIHLVWLKSRPLDKAARELVALMRDASQAE